MAVSALAKIFKISLEEAETCIISINTTYPELTREQIISFIIQEHEKLIEDFTAKLDDNLYFGKYPSDAELSILLGAGFDIFVDLTTEEEVTWTSYKLPKGITKMVCPIKDRTPNPEDPITFDNTLRAIATYYLQGHQIYIHCRGGHGRSGMVAAMVLVAVKGITPAESLKRVKEAHAKRKIMEDKWRKMGTPQTRSQKDFVLQYDYSKLKVSTKPIRFFSGKAKDINKSYEIFSNFSAVPIIVDEKEYPTTEHYFQAMKFILDDPAYAEEIRLSTTPLIAKRLGKSRKHPIRDGWNDVRIEVMRETLRIKAEQSKAFKQKLLETKGALIIEASPFDSFWGEGRTKNGKNMLGVLLMELRDTL